jgi:hypothetical protein
MHKTRTEREREWELIASKMSWLTGLLLESKVHATLMSTDNRRNIIDKTIGRRFGSFPGTKMLGFSLTWTNPTNSTAATGGICSCLCNKFRLYPWCVCLSTWDTSIVSGLIYGQKPLPRASLTPLIGKMSLLYKNQHYFSFFFNYWS